MHQIPVPFSFPKGLERLPIRGQSGASGQGQGVAGQGGSGQGVPWKQTVRNAS